MAESSLFTIIFGPTASGKSAQAYELAQKLNTDVLSFDSRHIYQEMDIVTGKDRPPQAWSHQLLGVDLVTPDQDFSIRHYHEYAKPIINSYRKRHQPLVLVGGSWQYVNVLIRPPASLLVPIDEKWRQQASTLTLNQLQTKLQQLDESKFSAMNQSDAANPRRLIRAVEVANQPEANKPEPLLLPDEYQLITKSPSINLITSQISKRIQERIEQGAIEETKNLIEKYPDWSTPAFSATGYGPLRQFIEGQINEATMKQTWLHQEREYAKRQLVWLKSLNLPVEES